MNGESGGQGWAGDTTARIGPETGPDDHAGDDSSLSHRLARSAVPRMGEGGLVGPGSAFEGDYGHEKG